MRSQGMFGFFDRPRRRSWVDRRSVSVARRRRADGRVIFAVSQSGPFRRDRGFRLPCFVAIISWQARFGRRTVLDGFPS